jgi:hypothetical protein
MPHQQQSRQKRLLELHKRMQMYEMTMSSGADEAAQNTIQMQPERQKEEMEDMDEEEDEFMRLFTWSSELTLE